MVDAVEVGTDVVALVQPGGTMGRSNSVAVIDGADSLVIDTMLVPELADAIEAQLRRRGATPRAVVNTHPHIDHVGGNARFADTVTLSLPATAEMVAALARDTSFLPRLFPAYAEELSRVEVRIPQPVAPQAWQLPGGAQALAAGPAHSPGDLAVWLPGQRVLAAGDLCFNAVTPLALPGHANLRGWVAALDRLIALDPLVVVPGHGPLGDVTTLITVRDYLHDVIRLAEAVAAGDLEQTRAVADLCAGPIGDWAEPGRSAGNLAVALAEVTGTAVENRQAPPIPRAPATP